MAKRKLCLGWPSRVMLDLLNDNWVSDSLRQPLAMLRKIPLHTGDTVSLSVLLFIKITKSFYFTHLQLSFLEN
jgi:hypothetical protein